MKIKECCCYNEHISPDDGCTMEWCDLYCSTEFDCDFCGHCENEKYLATMVKSLQQENTENQIDKNKLKKLEEKNKSLKKENTLLKNEVQELKALINKREHSVADFAVQNSRYVEYRRER